MTSTMLWFYVAIGCVQLLTVVTAADCPANCESCYFNGKTRTSWCTSDGCIIPAVYDHTNGQCVAQPLTNMALNKPAWQSSTLTPYVATKAVDGNNNTNINAGSCSHTGEGDYHPWLAVDLEQVAYVQRVEITNRGDCCGDHLNNFVVGLTDIAPSVVQPTDTNVQICGRGPAVTTNGATYKIECAAHLQPSRFVVVMTHTQGQNICELEVWASSPPLTNMALNKNAWQSSETAGGKAFRAVDGNKNVNYFSNSCSHTGYGDTDPWLAVDLGQVAYIQRVEVTNRGDCCGEHLAHFVVGLTNAAPNVVHPTDTNVQICGRGPTATTLGTTYKIVCAAGLRPARYVVIMLHQHQPLVICELEVYAAV